MNTAGCVGQQQPSGGSGPISEVKVTGLVDGVYREVCRERESKGTPGFFTVRILMLFTEKRRSREGNGIL